MKPYLEGGVSLYSGLFSFVRKRRKKNNFYIHNSFSCKEAFSRRFSKRTKYFTVSHVDGRFPIINQFFEEIEDTLDLNKKDRIKLIQFTNVKHCTLIQTSKWWRQNGIRREFLLIMLRNASNWHGVYDFDQILYSGYARRTEKAVYKFLKGYTHYFGYVRGHNGWYQNFSRKGNLSRMFRNPSLKRFFKLLDY